MKLTSTAFEAGGAIPPRYTCQGEDLSPPLDWNTVPDGTKSLVLICDDPDAPNGPFSHWVLYDIPPEQLGLAEGIPPKGRLDFGGAQGRNDFGTVGYGGPCPPIGETHRYYWRLYALDAPCELLQGATRAQVFDWIHDHLLEQTELVGTFTRT
ncbi:MAG: YbhB/YbcL family Raf kinase inhibitor-like protein [Chloroflexota bacterium]